MNKTKLLSLVTSCAIAVNLTPISVLGANAAYETMAVNASFSENQFEILRNEFFEDVEIGEKRLDLETIHIDSGNNYHVSQGDLPLPELIPYSDGEMSANAVVDSGPFDINDVRPFYLYGVGNGDITVNGKLMAQGKHVNIWILDNDDWLRKMGKPHEVGVVTAAMAKDLADRFDPVYEAMTNEETGFAKHANVQINTSYANFPTIGDMGNDGKVNFLLYDLYGDGATGGGGFAWSADFWTHNGSKKYNALDMLHVDISIDGGYKLFVGTEEEKISEFGTLPHEFQHMLFYMYFGLYNTNNLTSTGQDAYLWLNESLAQCAALYYLKPGYEIIKTYQTYIGTSNDYYYQGKYVDFLNFDSNKCYNMGLMMSSIFYKKTGGLYPHNLYNYFKILYPPAISPMYANTPANIAKVSANPMAVNVGNWFNYALSLGISDSKTAFSQAIRLFMESFAADGGTVVTPTTTTKTIKMYSSSNLPVDALWAWRVAFSYPDGDVYAGLNGTGSYYYPNYYSSYPIPELTSGENAILKGFGTTPPEGATQDKVYKLSGDDPSKSILSIKINDNNAATNYYVAVPNDEVVTGRYGIYTNGISGATLYHLTADGTPKIINTGGKPAWLFIATIYRNVNTSVTYSWESEFSGSVEFDNENPRYGDVITATVKDENGVNSTLNNLTYAWKVDGFAVSPNTVSNNFQNSYTIKDADVGKSVSVTVTSASKNQGSLTAQTAPVGKMINTATPIAPTTASKTGSRIVLADLGSTYEYSLGGRIWQDSPIFRGLTAETTYDFYSRIKATATTEASVSSAVHRETTGVFTIEPGDADGDGEVDNKDVVLLKQYLAEWDVKIFPGADADGDGEPTNKDVVLLKQYLADWDVTLG
jgi:hypothetical protein